MEYDCHLHKARPKRARSTARRTAFSSQSFSKRQRLFAERMCRTTSPDREWPKRSLIAWNEGNIGAMKLLNVARPWGIRTARGSRGIGLLLVAHCHGTV